MSGLNILFMKHNISKLIQQIGDTWNELHRIITYYEVLARKLQQVFINCRIFIFYYNMIYIIFELD